KHTGRGWHDCDARRAVAAARRLYLAAVHPFRPDQHRPLQERPVQAERSRPDLAHRQILLRARARERGSRRRFKAFVQYAKAHPGDVSYATIGAGSAQEILARRLEKLTGIAMNRIPFRTGTQVVQELVAGRV